MRSDSDRNGELRLERDGLTVSIAPSRTGETILQAREGPDAFWTGGPLRLRERVGSPPEDLGLQEWETRADQDGVTSTIAWRSLWLERRVSLHAEAPRLELEYAFLNTAPIFIRPAFGLRLLIPAPAEAAWYVPTTDGVRAEKFESGRAGKRYLRPGVPWCGVTAGGKGVALLFPEGVVDAVEVESGGSQGLFSLTPLVYYVGLNPGFEAKLTAVLAVDVALPEGAAELLAAPTHPLRAAYGPASPERRSRAAEAAVAGGDAPPVNTEALRACQALRERAERLSATKGERLALLAQLAKAKVSVEEVLAELRHTR
jgi:hypothetical protein